MDVRVVIASREGLPYALDAKTTAMERVQPASSRIGRRPLRRLPGDLQARGHESVAYGATVGSAIESHAEIGGMPIPVIRDVAVDRQLVVVRPRADDDPLAVEPGHRGDVVDGDRLQRSAGSCRAGGDKNLAGHAGTDLCRDAAAT